MAETTPMYGIEAGGGMASGGQLGGGIDFDFNGGGFNFGNFDFGGMLGGNTGGGFDFGSFDFAGILNGNSNQPAPSPTPTEQAPAPAPTPTPAPVEETAPAPTPAPTPTPDSAQPETTPENVEISREESERLRRIERNQRYEQLGPAPTPPNKRDFGFGSHGTYGRERSRDRKRGERRNRGRGFDQKGYDQAMREYKRQSRRYEVEKRHIDYEMRGQPARLPGKPAGSSNENQAQAATRAMNENGGGRMAGQAMQGKVGADSQQSSGGLGMGVTSAGASSASNSMQANTGPMKNPTLASMAKERTQKRAGLAGQFNKRTPTRSAHLLQGGKTEQARQQFRAQSPVKAAMLDRQNQENNTNLGAF